jgi:hypothetical protein
VKCSLLEKYQEEMEKVERQEQQRDPEALLE